MKKNPEIEDTIMANQMAQKALNPVIENHLADAGLLEDFHELSDTQNHRIRQKSQQSIKYTFTEIEKKKISEQLAQAVLEKDMAQNELKSVKGQFDARKKTADALISLHAQQLQSGYEYRMTDCEIIKDFRTGMIITRRLDTLDVVESHKMTGADRQMVIREG